VVTKAKPKTDWTGGLPLLLSPERTMFELGVGKSSLDELEEQGLLHPVPLGTLRVKRYGRDNVLELARAGLPETVKQIEASGQSADACAQSSPENYEFQECPPGRPPSRT